MKPVVVDAMGGDNAPNAIIEGVRQALEGGISVELVGDPDLLDDLGGLTLNPATEVIEMAEEPGKAVRLKKRFLYCESSGISKGWPCLGDGQRRQHRCCRSCGIIANEALKRRATASDSDSNPGTQRHSQDIARLRCYGRLSSRLAPAVRSNGFDIRQSTI